MCWGYNTKLNCLEYHRDSEVNAGETDFVLLLAKEDEIEDGRLDTAKVKAFRVPAGAAVEVYGTTLHYAPCQTEDRLPRRRRPAEGYEHGEACLRAAERRRCMDDRTQQVAAGPSGLQRSKTGAHIGLTGKNIDITEN